MCFFPIQPFLQYIAPYHMIPYTSLVQPFLKLLFSCEIMCDRLLSVCLSVCTVRTPVLAYRYMYRTQYVPVHTSHTSHTSIYVLGTVPGTTVVRTVRTSSTCTVRTVVYTVRTSTSNIQYK